MEEMVKFKKKVWSDSNARGISTCAQWIENLPIVFCDCFLCDILMEDTKI